MKFLYKTTIILILIFGIGHVGYTFLEHKVLNEPALWFFSAALGLLFNAGINYINLQVNNIITYRIALAANICLTLFTTVLAAIVPAVTTIGVALASVFITISCLIVKNTESATSIKSKLKNDTSRQKKVENANN